MKYRAILVERDSVMLPHLAGALKADADFDLAATYHDAEQALGQCSVFRPNLFLIDVDAPKGLELLPEFIDFFPQADFLGTMEHWKAETAEKVIQAGALGRIVKPFRTRDILKASELY